MSAPSPDSPLEPGVSLALARVRAGVLSEVRYSLSLTIDVDAAVPVTGRVTTRFTLPDPHDVVFDFASAPALLQSADAGGRPFEPVLTSEHIVVPAGLTRVGVNEVTFWFVIDAGVLHRQADLLYSLFVPARARLAFPCFDQPDIKGRFTLTMNVPPAWSVVSNAPVDSESATAGGRSVTFRETEPLPTYLFAFVAGTLAVDAGEREGRVIRVWHREPDRTLVGRNLDEILDLHARALSWLEAYTGVPYPFSQFDIVLVPSFQFSGMEHPGAIYYNAGRLLLEQTATGHDHVTRAALIAHETAHVWFGDLVTMRWFDDVWLKEVFANFMAEKIVAEQFPAQNHGLRFFLANYPQAYAVDRSAGANPIRQPLDNLSDAGHLYGPIIYLKAPILFRQLELKLGEDRFRDGARRYLRAHRFGNASWADLLGHMAPDDDGAIAAWGASWMEEAGRPRVSVEPAFTPDGALAALTCRSIDPEGLGRSWPQQIRVALGYDDRVEHVTLDITGEVTRVLVSAERPSYVLGGGAGLGYGRFPLDPVSRGWLLANAERIPDPLTRGVAWVSLWDELLEDEVRPAAWTSAVLRALAAEPEAQNIEYLLAALGRAFWLFLSATEREAAAVGLEACLRGRLDQASSARACAPWFAALRQLTTTDRGCAWLEGVWRRQERVPGLPLGEAEETVLALDLAVRGGSACHDILDGQRSRIQDDERRARFEFLAPFLSADPREREMAFAALTDVRARTREPWVLTALQYLNHPLRQAHARRFIRPGLELLPEVGRTGDIFFASRWAEALLAGHASPAAAAIVREFIADHPELPMRLRRMVLNAADLLFRSGRPPF